MDSTALADQVVADRVVGRVAADAAVVVVAAAAAAAVSWVQSGNRMDRLRIRDRMGAECEQLLGDGHSDSEAGVGQEYADREHYGDAVYSGLDEAEPRSSLCF